MRGIRTEVFGLSSWVPFPGKGKSGEEPLRASVGEVRKHLLVIEIRKNRSRSILVEQQMKASLRS